MTSFSQKDLIRAVRATTGLAPGDAEEAVMATFAIIREEAASGRVVRIRGFGQFAVKDRAARMMRSPLTGDAVEVPARRVLTFKASKPVT